MPCERNHIHERLWVVGSSQAAAAIVHNNESPKDHCQVAMDYR